MQINDKKKRQGGKGNVEAIMKKRNIPFFSRL
jgi:hypothetical protein